VKTASVKRCSTACPERARIEGIARAAEDVAALPDPVGIVETGSVRPNGLQIQKTRVPMGVIAMITKPGPM
jgi:glutamate-5-semialdehyde dehydrogenase